MYVLPRTSLTLTVPALALAAILAGNGWIRPDAAVDTPSDRSLRISVKDALRYDVVTTDLSIKVDTRNAAVTLTGELDKDEQVAQALRIAREVTGVREVVNRLTVKGENRAERSAQG